MAAAQGAASGRAALRRWRLRHARPARLLRRDRLAAVVEPAGRGLSAGAQYRTRWRGLLLRRSAGALSGDFYWARVPVEGGVAFELAGWKTLPEGAALADWATALLGAPDGAERLDYADPARGWYRWASIRDGRLDGCLFLSPAGN